MSPAGMFVETANVPLRWSESTNATSYDIAMSFLNSRDEWKDYYAWEGKSGASFTVYPVVDDTYYAWSIRACNSMGCSEWSDFEEFYFGAS